jgi:riboflavin synthase
MFTGIVTAQGTVMARQMFAGEVYHCRLGISAVSADWQTGESVAINGVCLTLLPDFSDGLWFDLSAETLAMTNLASLQVGDVVNLEQAMHAQSRFGGHYVSGHVDTTAVLEQRKEQAGFLEMVIGGFDKCDMMYLMRKGSITLEGVSLTINHVFDRSISVMLVPHTLASTTLGSKRIGQMLNVEFDYMTRIIAQQMRMMQGSEEQNEQTVFNY